MKNSISKLIVIVILLFNISCDKEDDHVKPVTDEEIFRLVVVVHVLHNGETVGEGSNISDERIKRQIDILNEDFRRKKGTPGFNDHPSGGDTKIEFVLAKQDPLGNPTDGIIRIDTSQFDLPNLGYNQNNAAQYSYWDPDRYINIWTALLPEETMCLVLGVSSCPETDLPGAHLIPAPGPGDADGILINHFHFGESNINCHARFGRTLTHEMGHYLGLLHPWGERDCTLNDYCNDTPPVDTFVFGRNSFSGCAGEAIMIENYMNYSNDDVMNTFTTDQIARMHYVLKNSVRRKTLPSATALRVP